jgi:hypothetical protein
LNPVDPSRKQKGKRKGLLSRLAAAVAVGGGGASEKCVGSSKGKIEVEKCFNLGENRIKESLWGGRSGAGGTLEGK